MVTSMAVYSDIWDTYIYIQLVYRFGGGVAVVYRYILGVIKLWLVQFTSGRMTVCSDEGFRIDS